MLRALGRLSSVAHTSPARAMGSRVVATTCHEVSPDWIGPSSRSLSGGNGLWRMPESLCLVACKCGVGRVREACARVARPMVAPSRWPSQRRAPEHAPGVVQPKIQCFPTPHTVLGTATAWEHHRCNVERTSLGSLFLGTVTNGSHSTPRPTDAAAGTSAVSEGLRRICTCRKVVVGAPAQRRIAKPARRLRKLGSPARERPPRAQGYGAAPFPARLRRGLQGTRHPHGASYRRHQHLNNPLLSAYKGAQVSREPLCTASHGRSGAACLDLMENVECDPWLLPISRNAMSP